MTLPSPFYHHPIAKFCLTCPCQITATSTALYRTFISQSFVRGNNSNDPVAGHVSGVVVDEGGHTVCLPSVTWNVVVDGGWSLMRGVVNEGFYCSRHQRELIFYCSKVWTFLLAMVHWRNAGQTVQRHRLATFLLSWKAGWVSTRVVLTHKVPNAISIAITRWQVHLLLVPYNMYFNSH